MLNSWHVPLRVLLWLLQLVFSRFTLLDISRLLHSLWQLGNTLTDYELRLRLTLSLRHVVVATIRILTLVMILRFARVLVHLLLHVLVRHLLLELHLLFHALSIELLLDVLVRRWLELLLLLLVIHTAVNADGAVRTLIHIVLITHVCLILLWIEELHTS